MRNLALIVLSGLILNGCYQEYDYLYTADDIFKDVTVTFSPDSIPADLDTSLIMTIKMPITSDTSLTKFNLKCSNGTFVESDSDKLSTNLSQVSGDQENRYIEVEIKASNLADSNHVTIELAGYEKTVSYLLTNSAPSRVQLSSSVYYVGNDSLSEIPLSAIVKSTTGNASKGPKVSFSVGSTQPASFFFSSEPVSLNAESVAANTLVLQSDTTFTGEVQVVASVSPSITDTITVHVVD